MPAAHPLVMPSVFPEAFGMVAAEAAACRGSAGTPGEAARLGRGVPARRALSFAWATAPEAPPRGINGWLAGRASGWEAFAPARRARSWGGPEG
jgi:hypothetical protein